MKALCLTLRIGIVILSLFMSISVSATNISGTLTQDDTLKLDGSPYILTGDLTIPDSVSLFIEPGVEINLSYYTRDILVYGTLIAEGTVLDTIRFYSSSVTGGGSVALLGNSQNNNLQYCEFNNLGNEGGSINSSAYDTGLYIAEATYLVDHCTFINCGTNRNIDIRVDADFASGFGPSNDVNLILFINNSLDTTSYWSNRV